MRPPTEIGIDSRVGQVVITGAASGIGRAVALDQARAGRRLALLDVDIDGLELVRRDALRAGAEAVTTWRCDVSDESQVVAAFRGIRENSPVVAAFSNAGIERNAPAHEMDPGTWARVLDTNLTGSFLVCRESIRSMLEQRRGSIVCTSSPAAFQGFVAGGNAAYAASKGGVGAFVRSLAVDYAPYGIRVNAVVPGAIDTAMLLAEIEPDLQAESRMRMEAAAREQIPLGRMGRAEEIAAAVGWLLGDESSYVTGSHLVCDGGLMARSSNSF